MPKPTAYRTPVRTNPFSTPRVRGGEIVPYVPPVPTAPPPVRLNTEPYVPNRPKNSAPPPRPIPGEIIEGEVVKTENRRPVVGRDGKPSSESSHPQNYPQYPDPGAAWNTMGDWARYQHGMAVPDRQSAERDAYELTKNWKAENGNVTYPFGPFFPTVPIGDKNLDLANKYRAQNGLPAIDALGKEQAPARSPNRQPDSDYGSNPFNQKRTRPLPTQGTPSNFQQDPNDYSIDPDTGKPYTESQKDGARTYGRPEWHMDPTTGKPWGSDEPGAPIPLPFNGYPGGGLTRPAPPTSPNARGTITVTVRVVYPYGSDSVITKSFPGSSGSVVEVRGGIDAPSDLVIDGVVAHPAWTKAPQDGGGAMSIDSFSFDGPATNPAPSSDSPEFTPIGSPARQSPNLTKPKPTPSPRPEPRPDPRVNPSPAPKLPYAPNKTLPDNPYTTPVNPVPAPIVRTVPRIPSQPDYSPAPRPYPRLGPDGKPTNPIGNENRPEPARPSTPKTDTLIDRPTNKPPTKPGNDGTGDKCPDPCPKPETTQITYKRFKGCLITFDGKPDRFSNESMIVPRDSAPAIKSMLDSIADIKSLECKPCCYWAIKPGRERLIFTGVPLVQGQEVLLTAGCNEFMIEFNPQNALLDKNLRNMRRSTNPVTDETTFINTAIVYIVSSSGHVVHSQELWVPKWKFTIPFIYRNDSMRVRIMPKGIVVNFKVIDTGGKWTEFTS